MNGQLLEEGITEAGALSSWVAAGTAYSVPGIAMLPFYIYCSMFSFQRIGDLIWAAADQRIPRLSVWRHRRVAPRSAARDCSTRTAPVLSLRPSCPTAAPTSRPLPVSWR
jgi:hypothetical protein